MAYLGYWDIYKNYYANKQEEIAGRGTVGYVIHGEDLENEYVLSPERVNVYLDGNLEGDCYDNTITINNGGGTLPFSTRLEFQLAWNQSPTTPYGAPDLSRMIITIDGVGTKLRYQDGGAWGVVEMIDEMLDGVPGKKYRVICSQYVGTNGSAVTFNMSPGVPNNPVSNVLPRANGEPQLHSFDLDNIDTMREEILAAVGQTTAFIVDHNSPEPYNLGLDTVGGVSSGDYEDAFAISNQEGLGIKTYQSDLFNNWISTEWIDGTNGIAEVTAVSTAGNEFTIDALNLANKVYNMLNRIAISGGSYDDWLDAVYTHERAKSTESPVYHGSLIKSLAFEEVISNSDTEVGDETQPLGTLAGRGRLTNKNKGGKIRIKCHEPSYIIGIVSITPGAGGLDYSQGNKWDVNLENMDQFHKPALDEIGFEDLITDQMAWFDSEQDPSSGNWAYKSAGKQPAWINYMTNVNQCRGNFADDGAGGEMFMTLNRRYDMTGDGIGDLSTYVDPSKFNYIFAETNLDAQNFWTQIKVENKARRKMSAKIMPNL